MSFSEIKTAVQTLFDQNKNRHLFTTGIEKGTGSTLIQTKECPNRALPL